MYLETGANVLMLVCVVPSSVLDVFIELIVVVYLLFVVGYMILVVKYTIFFLFSSSLTVSVLLGHLMISSVTSFCKTMCTPVQATESTLN